MCIIEEKKKQLTFDENVSIIVIVVCVNDMFLHQSEDVKIPIKEKMMKSYKEKKFNHKDREKFKRNLVEETVEKFCAFSDEFFETKEEFLKALKESIEKELDATTKRNNTKKVEFFRYFRPVYGKIKKRPNPRLEFNPEPTMGITYYVILDFDERTVTISYSICNGDLFNKKIGKELAKKHMNERAITFPYPKQGFDENGIINYFVNKIATKPEYIDNQNIQTLLKMHKSNHSIIC